jgi:hypothetical protein
MAGCRLGTLELGKEADRTLTFAGNIDCQKIMNASLAALNNFPFTVQTRCTILGQCHVRQILRPGTGCIWPTVTPLTCPNSGRAASSNSTVMNLLSLRK